MGQRLTAPIYVDANGQFKVANFTRIKRTGVRTFGWYGGKSVHLKWILPLLPKSYHFCEVFGGSGAVLLNRVPSRIETYNDLDGSVVHFFRTLRDKKDELIEAITLTPVSREEYHLASYGTDDASDVERARRFYVRARQSHEGLAQKATLGLWRKSKTVSGSGMSRITSQWLSGIAGLEAVCNRLLRVQIENRPALDLIQGFDSPEMLFYCDPPYPHFVRSKSSTAYAFEMTDDQHDELAQVLNAC